MRKTITIAIVAVVATLGLAGCVPSKLAESISDTERAEFQSRCMEVRGEFHGNLPHEVPTCTVIYDYPSVPERLNPSDSVEGK